MRHFLFEINHGEYEGEDFIVGAENYGKARAIARAMFGKVYFLCELSDTEAEMSGLDEY